MIKVKTKAIMKQNNQLIIALIFLPLSLLNKLYFWTASPNELYSFLGFEIAYYVWREGLFFLKRENQEREWLAFLLRPREYNSLLVHLSSISDHLLPSGS